ncbi:MAG: hypothetical protein ACK4MV_07400 [Beijerinckiaceae bacterium]
MKAAALLLPFAALLPGAGAAHADLTPPPSARYRPYAEAIQKYGYDCPAVVLRQDLTFGKEFDAYKRAGGYGYIVRCSNDRFYAIGVDRRGRIAPRKDMVSPAG